MLWLAYGQFGRNVLSTVIAVLAVLNLCPWFAPYQTAQPFLLGHPWWLAVWFLLSFLLFLLLYVRLFYLEDRDGMDDLPVIWERLRARFETEEDSPRA